MKISAGSHSHRITKTLAAAVIAGVVIMTAGCASIPPPTDQLAVSRAAVNDAANSGATEFAAVELKSARDKLDQAEQAMAAKEYERAKALAEEAQVDAKVAETKSRAAKAQKAIESAKESNRVLREELERSQQNSQSPAP